MYILGLTGSIGMGKSTAARAFRHYGVSVFDADVNTHKLTGVGGSAVTAVGDAFPGTVKNGFVNRSLLGKLVFNDKVALARLEKILHPLVREAQNKFIRLAAKRRENLLVLDVPLLFEVGSNLLCDGVAVVTAPKFIQKIRVLSRVGMTQQLFSQVLESQMPDTEKKKRADFIIPTSMGRNFSLLRIRNIITTIQGCSGHQWAPKRVNF
jgi:dephospho-CoA kinase